MPKPVPEWDPPSAPAWRNLVTSPTSLGVATAALLSSNPNLLPLQGNLAALDTPLSPRAVTGVVGFALGYGLGRFMEWTRVQAITKLLSYHGWVYDQKSVKTKMWAILLKLLKGSGPYKTLEFQPNMPHLPLPELDESLDRWLGVCKVLLTPDEFELAKSAIEDFRVNEGPKLQKYLQKRYIDKVNWLSDYWASVAYLSGREPIAVNSNFYFNSQVPLKRSTSRLARAVNNVHNVCRFRELVFQQRIPPAQLQGLVPLCMSGERFLFNSARLPGEHLDSIVSHNTCTHIVVIRKGHYFKMDMYQPDANGKMSLLSRTEIGRLLEGIYNTADAMTEAPLPVAALTAQRRDTWFKHREQLKAQNPELLHLVESAMFLVVLDDHKPKDTSEHAEMSLGGAGYDRWFDKSFTLITYDNARGGVNVEHSVIDGTVSTHLGEFCLAEEKYDADGSFLVDPSEPSHRDLAPAQMLTWNLAGMEDTIKQADDTYRKLREDVQIKVVHTKYGKGFMKKARLSPDGYIQMAFQLAFYRLHKTTPKTYEPSTARMFALGRTETVHPISEHSVDWVKAMDDPSAGKDQREKLLRAAIKHQTNFRLDATVGHGSDRHLLGLYCAARELGMDIPRVFRDKAFQLPFRLSTSQVPIQFPEWYLDLEYPQCAGGFGPVAKDGYGVCYCQIRDDYFILHVSTWRSCEETSSIRFEEALHKAMDDMKELLKKEP